ncbi:MAG: hypothetical protein H8D78_09085 [Chloroflexi bacterium]|nr:hypothetical protein [Chloroflexota bacterium]
MMNVVEVYRNHVKTLPVVDRLQLARLIMDDLAESAPRWVVDVSDAWSEEDLRDLTWASFAYAAQQWGSEAGDA